MFEKIIEEVKNANSIYVSGHINPDGDSIGSTFAVYLALKKMGKDVKPILTKYSKTFSFLPFINEAKDHVEEEKYDLLICVDSSSKERIAIGEEGFSKANRTVLIDPHVKDKDYVDVSVVDQELPAASELVYNFINELNVEIDENIASFLYMGIMTDTGSFNYSSTKPSTYMIAAKLIEAGADFSYICKMINDTMSEGKLYLIKSAIERMEKYYDSMVRYTFIDYKTISSYDVDDEDAEGMTNYLRAVSGTEVAIYVREKSTGELKVSMRSGGKVDIADVAIKFGGGGHKRAAGFTMNIDGSTYEEEKKKLLDYIGVKLNDDFAG